jgi:hypothetical protein
MQELEVRSNITTKRSYKGRLEEPKRQQLLLKATKKKLLERELERDY